MAPFDTTAFLLSTNQVSRPIKTQYGYHVIQPISAIKPAKVTPLKDAKPAIQAHAPRQGEDGRDHQVDGRHQELLRQEGRVRDRVRPARGRDRPGDDHRLSAVPQAGDGQLAEALVDLQELTKRLRRDCPWDREQTARTIVPHTVEEAYEVADAAYAGDPAKLLDELGDLLFQTYFLALLLEEQGQGDLEAVARAVHAKLVRRHPHVFGDAGRRLGRPGPRAVGGRSRPSRRAAPESSTTFPRRFPGCSTPARCSAARPPSGSTGPSSTARSRRCARSSARSRSSSARAGRPAPETEADPRVFAELGDLLFTVVNVARVVNVDPELALRATSRRFVARVELAERLAADAGETWAELDLDAQERWYVDAKDRLAADAGLDASQPAASSFAVSEARLSA